MPRYIALGAVVGFAVAVLLVSICSKESAGPDAVVPAAPSNPVIPVPERSPLDLGRPVRLPRVPHIGLPIGGPDAGPPAPAPDAGASDAGS